MNSRFDIDNMQTVARVRLSLLQNAKIQIIFGMAKKNIPAPIIPALPQLSYPLKQCRKYHSRKKR